MSNDHSLSPKFPIALNKNPPSAYTNSLLSKQDKQRLLTMLFIYYQHLPPPKNSLLHLSRKDFFNVISHGKVRDMEIHTSLLSFKFESNHKATQSVESKVFFLIKKHQFSSTLLHLLQTW